MQTTKDFLLAVTPHRGFRYLFAIMPDGRPVQRDFGGDELDDMIGFATWCFQTKQANVYAAVGGYEPVGGKMARTGACARWHRSLRVDVDCGPGKPYATQRDGAQALAKFLHDARLPRPWVVDSGYGLHVYWTFGQDIPLEQWKPMADALQGRAQALGFAVDSTTTADAARVLRLPGTRNYKRGEVKVVRILAQGVDTAPSLLSEALGALPAAPGALALAVPASLLDATRGELGAEQYPPYTLRGVLTGCPGMADLLKAGGAYAAEPLWKFSLDLINRAEEPDHVKLRVAHAVSSKHPGYTPEGLEEKWAQVQRQNYHPPTCATLGGAGLPACATCPLRATLRSPVVLGRPQAPVAADTAAIPALPAPLPALRTVGAVQHGVFLIDPMTPAVRIVDGALTSRLCIRGGVPHVTMTVDAPGPEGQAGSKEVLKPIGSYRLIEAERLLDRMGRQSITALTFDRAKDGTVQIEATNADMSEPRAFNKLLLAHGLYMPSSDIKLLQDKFMPEFLAQFQRVRAANQIAARCGWTDDRSGFVLGTTLHTRAGQEHIRPTGAVDEMQAYHTAGDEVAWRRAFDLCLAGGPDRQAVLALAIAAPLMVYTGVDGVMLNAYSPESGVGKSTLCDAVLSIWGSPNKLRKDYRDTANATFKLAAVVGNLPMVVDEFTNVDGKALSDYVYTITQGREKHRLTSDSKLHTNSSRWCLPTIVTSNNSVHDKLQSFRGDAVAEAARVFELRLRPLNVPADVMGQRKTDLLALRSCYGFLGPRLVQLMLQRDPARWQEMVTARIAWWDKEVSVDTSDRFRSACAALIDIGAAIGNALGFNFEREKIMECIRAQWLDQQAEFELSRREPLDFINEYIVENLADFAIIGGTLSETLMAHGRRYRGEIRGRAVNGRFVPDRVVLPLAAFRDYVRERNGNYKSLLEWMRAEMRPDGCVEKVGQMNFLDGMVQQVRTQAVALRASVLGTTSLRVASPPPAPTMLDSARPAR